MGCGFSYGALVRVSGTREHLSVMSTSSRPAIVLLYSTTRTHNEKLAINGTTLLFH